MTSLYYVVVVNLKAFSLYSNKRWEHEYSKTIQENKRFTDLLLNQPRAKVTNQSKVWGDIPLYGVWKMTIDDKFPILIEEAPQLNENGSIAFMWGRDPYTQELRAISPEYRQMKNVNQYSGKKVYRLIEGRRNST